MNQIKIIVVEDHSVTREGIRSLFSTIKEVSIIAEAANGSELLQLLELHPDVDIITMDIRLPDISGIELTKIVLDKYDKIRIIALTMHEEEAYIINMLQAGAMGYVLKNTTREELFHCISLVATGNPYFSPKIAEVVLSKYMGSRQDQHEDNSIAPEGLTKREKEILRLIGMELTTQQIADRLFISPRTVENHRSKIMQKLDVKSSVGLIKYAVKYGLIE